MKHAVVGAIFLIAGVVFCVQGYHDAGYAQGHGGTPGKVTIVRCGRTHGTNRDGDVTCYGPFRSDDGSLTEPGAEIGDSFPIGDHVPVRRVARGDYVPVGGLAVTTDWIAVVIGGAAVIGGLVQILKAVRPGFRLRGRRDGPFPG